MTMKRHSIQYIEWTVLLTKHGLLEKRVKAIEKNRN